PGCACASTGARAGSFGGPGPGPYAVLGGDGLAGDVPAGDGDGGCGAAQVLVAVHGGERLALAGPERHVVVAPEDRQHLVVAAQGYPGPARPPHVGAGQERRDRPVTDVDDGDLGDVLVVVVARDG